jgi:hypothetical protein
VPSHLRKHFTHAVGAQTAGVAERIVATVAVNGPTDDDHLASLRADGFALSDEAAPTPATPPSAVGFASLAGALGSFDHGTHTSISDAGHYLPLEQAAIFAAVTGSWLAQCQTHLDANST